MEIQNSVAVLNRPAMSDERSQSVRRLQDLTDPCILCPRRCGAHRREGQTWFCGIGDEPVVSSIGPHFGEESVLVGAGGSGTIFFAGCNLSCIFCQNFDISHQRHGPVPALLPSVVTSGDQPPPNARRNPVRPPICHQEGPECSRSVRTNFLPGNMV